MPVCVKMLKHDLAMDPDFQRNFRNEARLIASFDHPNIIRVYDIEERFRTIFIIMELLEGLALSDLLKQGQNLSYGQIVSILMQVCQGLSYAHSQGIIHQDIRPDNIFILPNRQVKILDFGVAAPVVVRDLISLAPCTIWPPNRLTATQSSPAQTSMPWAQQPMRW